MSIRDFRAFRFQVSKKPYDFCAAVGADVLRHNVRLFQKELGIFTEDVYFMKQTHSDHVIKVDAHTKSRDFFGYRIIDDVDALITNKPSVLLVSRISDCTPIAIYDPIHHAQACIHAGWRPTVKKIPLKVLAEMHDAYGTRPEDVYVYIGPSIGKSSFEVGKEVSRLWRDAFDFANDVIRIVDRTHDYIDIKMTHIQMLLNLGVNASRITVSAADTFTDSRYHSYRRDKPNFGSNALMSILK